MWICGQDFTAELIERIQTTVEGLPSMSVRELSRRVCEWLDWRAPNGKLQDMSCRKALLELERRGMICLPERQKKRYGFERRREKSGEEIPDLAEVSCGLKALGEVTVLRVPSRYSKLSKIWKGMMEGFHYLGSGPLCGAQIRYVVRSETSGWLGALSFSAGTKHLKDRDKWIGWSTKARHIHLREVVCNSRFLILPTVQVRNLASHVLSVCTDRLAEDWDERYGYKPVLVETFVDPVQFRGTCYRAANWIRIGQTTGEGRTYPNGKQSGGKKDIYVYPLSKDWQSTLTKEPDRGLDLTRVPSDPEDWAERELGGMEVYDVRLRERLVTLARDFAERPGAPIAQACNGDIAKTTAAYRFMANTEVSMDKVIKAHTEATIARIQKHRIVLSAQDTTTLNYTPHPHNKGMGPINTQKDKGVGLILHDTMAFTEQGTPLGLLDVQCWARDPEQAGKSVKRGELPIEQKESMKWLRSFRATAEVQSLCPETMIISVGDREADIYELFYEWTKGEGPELLVRSERSRNRKVGKDSLWERMQNEPVSGHRDVDVPGKGGRSSRTAKLYVRYAQVTLESPRDTHLPTVGVWAVYAQEVAPPANVKTPLNWMLLTTVKVASHKDACERIEWYCRRWGIETYHRTLKSGCRIEDRRLDDANSIMTCLAIDMVVAWRTFWLTMQSRETPDVPCDVFFTEDEWHTLYLHDRGAPLPKKAPSLLDAVFMLAALGGFLRRIADGYPGTTHIWRGLIRLADMTAGFRLAMAFLRIRAP